MELNKRTIYYDQEGLSIQRNEDASVTIFFADQERPHFNKELTTINADRWASIVTHVAKQNHDLSLINKCASMLHNGEIGDAQLFDL